MLDHIHRFSLATEVITIYYIILYIYILYPKVIKRPVHRPMAPLNFAGSTGVTWLFGRGAHPILFIWDLRHSCFGCFTLTLGVEVTWLWICFCFLNFKKMERMEKSKQELNGAPLFWRTLKVRPERLSHEMHIPAIYIYISSRAFDFTSPYQLHSKSIELRSHVLSLCLRRPLAPACQSLIFLDCKISERQWLRILIISLCSSSEPLTLMSLKVDVALFCSFFHQYAF